MKIFMCSSKAADRKFCYVSRHISPYDAPMSQGKPLLPLLQEFGAERVDFEIDEDRGGLELPDLVGNRLNYLVMRNPVVEAIDAKFEFGPHEKAAVALLKKRKKVHSADYTVINPHGQVDVLDESQSEFDAGGFVQIFGKYALSAAKIPKDRDVYRAKGLVSGYLFSERLVDFIRAQHYTNFEFTEVRVS